MFSEQTYDVLKQRILDNMNIDIDKREGSFTDAMISPLVEELAKAYINMGDILNLGFIADTFDTYLDKRVSEFGVYRKLGAKATGAIKVTGQQGAIIENGTIVAANDLSYIVLNDIVLSDIDNIIHVEALEVGYKYNLLASTEFKLVEADSNITSLINEASFTSGIDVETDEDLRERFAKVITSPPTSGNKSHYEIWALEVEGVGKASVYPLWNGSGTVKVMVVGSDDKPVAAEIITNTQTHIDENKPIGCTLTVVTPTLLNVVIVASIELATGYIIEDVKASFEESLNTYLKTVTTELTYSKVYGILVSQLGVVDIQTLTLNDATTNIAIPTDKIVNISIITLSGVV